MKRLSALLLASALGAWLTGCASSSVTTASPVFATTRSGLVAVASGHEHDVRASLPAAVDAVRVPEGTREGIPLPEPALPARDLQLAGPTPQIPIPRSGGLASPVE
ncbi:MAG: hypothetical protein U0324_11260 [Polyangiales bacterium]